MGKYTFQNIKFAWETHGQESRYGLLKLAKRYFKWLEFLYVTLSTEKCTQVSVTLTS